MSFVGGGGGGGKKREAYKQQQNFNHKNRKEAYNLDVCVGMS